MLTRRHFLYGTLAAGSSAFGPVYRSAAKLEGQPNWRSPGEDMKMPAPPHDATGHTWHHDNALLFEYTQRGGQEALASRGVTGFTSGMPGFSEIITDDEIWDILAYIKSTWPTRMQEVQAARNPPHE